MPRHPQGECRFVPTRLLLPAVVVVCFGLGLALALATAPPQEAVAKSTGANDAGRPAPLLIAEHPSAQSAAGQPRPRTLFRRSEVVELQDGRVAKYTGWVRSDLPPAVTVKLPGSRRNRRSPDARHTAITLVLEAGATKRIDLTAN